jgi:acetyl-CoA carboxylase biotin carboxyl carrier protein
MNIKKIKELVDLMNDNGLTEVEIEQEGVRVKLSKKAQGIIEQIVTAAPAEKPQEKVAAPAEGGKVLQEITAPMVGTFYRSPAPDVESYVEVGDMVRKGDVVCIIEAMKLMNEVKAEITGKIVEIPVENAEPVEYGQALFLVEPV